MTAQRTAQFNQTLGLSVFSLVWNYHRQMMNTLDEHLQG